MISTKIIKIIWGSTLCFIFLFSFFNNSSSKGLQIHRQPKIILEIFENGYVNGNIYVQNPLFSNKSIATEQDCLFLINIPFKQQQNWIIPDSENDINIAFLNSGDFYSIYAILMPSTKESFSFTIHNIIPIKETLAGNGKIDIFPISPTNKYINTINNIPNTLSVWELSIELPDSYDISDIKYDPKILQKQNNNTFSLIGNNTPYIKDIVSITFPSPFENTKTLFSGFLGLMVGLLGLFVENNFYNNLDLKKAILFLILSFLALITSIYFILFSQNHLFYIASTIGTIVMVFNNIYWSVRFLFARKFQATLYGKITSNGTDATYVNIKLFEINGEEKREIDSKTKIVDGNYEFNVWLFTEPKSFLLSFSEANSTRPIPSNEYTIRRKQRQLIAPVNL